MTEEEFQAMLAQIYMSKIPERSTPITKMTEEAFEEFLSHIDEQIRIAPEREWLTAADPTTMLSVVLKETLSPRKALLYNCACCRRIQHLMKDERSRFGVGMAELMADEEAKDTELEEVREQTTSAYLESSQLANEDYSSAEEETTAYVQMMAAQAARDLFVEDGQYPFSAAVGALGAVEEYQVELKSQVTLVREIFGNPFRPITLDPSWLTSTVLALATGIYQEKAFDRMPILADALQDAGCDNEEVLNHCRQPGDHVKGCWVVDLILSKQ